jgi:hypothetical protein
MSIAIHMRHDNFTKLYGPTKRLSGVLIYVFRAESYTAAQVQ